MLSRKHIEAELDKPLNDKNIQNLVAYLRSLKSNISANKKAVTDNEIKLEQILSDIETVKTETEVRNLFSRYGISYN